uniref:Uncharacterized protein n=1 Tax=mine drainage metagenome TaxID=410659 RepID=E6PXV2_9ZZZZ
MVFKAVADPGIAPQKELNQRAKKHTSGVRFLPMLLYLSRFQGEEMLQFFRIAGRFQTQTSLDGNCTKSFVRPMNAARDDARLSSTTAAKRDGKML